MRKINKIMMTLALVGLVATIFNGVNAEEEHIDIFNLQTNKEVYYEGESVEMQIRFADEYYTKFNNQKKVTDFEMAASEISPGGMGMIELVPVLQDANWSEERWVIYYIQTTAMSQKTKFVGGEHIANYNGTISSDIFSEEDIEYNEYEEYRVGGTYYFDDDTSCSAKGIKRISIVPYEIGDFTRDHEVDFFDITNLISVVYEMSFEEIQEIDWRKTRAIAANTKEYVADENYDITTAELGFMDIIYLIKTVYD